MKSQILRSLKDYISDIFIVTGLILTGVGVAGIWGIYVSISISGLLLLLFGYIMATKQ